MLAPSLPSPLSVPSVWLVWLGLAPSTCRLPQLCLASLAAPHAATRTHRAYKSHEGHKQDGSHFRLHIHAIGAKGLKNADLFGKSDPFATFDVGHIKLKTKVIDNNLNPVWNEQLEMGVLPANLKDHIEIEVYDEDPGSNDLLGKTFVNFDQVPHGTPKRFDLALNTQGSIQVELWTSGEHNPAAAE